MESSFLPVKWPEEKAPSEAVNCQKCELHYQRTRVIWGEGNPQAPIVVILDNPGALEDKDGNPFICGTRQTLQQAAFEAGLKMEDLYITYILKCRPTRRYDKESARSLCIEYLIQQIQHQKPNFIFCLGNTAVQWFFEDMEAEVKNLRCKWHTVRSILTCVSYYPLAARRHPNLYNQFLEDWMTLAHRYFNANSGIKF